MNKCLSTKRKIYNLVEKGSHGSGINLLFDYFIIVLILLNTISIAIDTINNISEELKIFLRIFESISIIVFSVEFILRIYVSDITHPARNRFTSVTKFLLSPFGLVDLFAILPFYLPFVISIDLRFLRMLRLIRFFRILKISRYNSTLKLMGSVLREKMPELGMTFFIASLMILISAFLMYSTENPVQPANFPDIFASLWWSIATLTTVGHVDIYPITTLGKIISSIVAALGIGLIALPTGIISAGFLEKIRDQKKKTKETICPYCGKMIMEKED